MPRLTLKEQRKIAKALPPRVVRQAVDQAGQGIFKDIARGTVGAAKAVGKVGKKAVKTLAPVVKAVGPTVLKEIVTPIARQRIAKGSGLNPAGRGLKLAGQGRKKKH